MDIELVQQLIEAFSQLGGEAKEAFLWYVILTKLPSFLLGLIWTGIGGYTLVLLAQTLRRLVASVSSSSKLREAANVSICWSPKELTQACNVLREHYRP